MHAGIFRYFTNQTNPPFIRDPFHHIILEEKGEIAKHDLKRKVTFAELFYDLFVVAALTVFSREDGLATGPDLASYIIFFAALWAVWASQTVFDVRYGTNDGMLWILGYLQLCVFGIFAAVSGDFDLTLGLTSFDDSGEPPSAEQYHRLTTVPHWIRKPPGGMRNASATARSLMSASGTFAVSRCILLVQYCIVYHYARKHKRTKDQRALYWHIGGTLFSSAMWFSAMAISFVDGKASGIGRIALWTAGLAFEFLCMVAAALTQPAYKLDLEYWAERFSALTLIVIGEGIISLFEAFQSVIQGVSDTVDVGHRGVFAGLIIAATGLYRMLYYLYFGQHTHHLRGGVLGHVAWGCLHFPLHLSILLLTQCASHVIFATNVAIGTDTITAAFTELGEAIAPALATNNITALQEAMFLSPQADYLRVIESNIDLDWDANGALLLTHANGNLSLVSSLMIGEEYDSISQLFSNYHFKPSAKSYTYINLALNESDNDLYSDFADKYAVALMKPVYVSMQYGFTVLGGCFVCLGLLSMLQEGPSKKHTSPTPHPKKRPPHFYHRISMFYRFGLGVVLLLLTLLDIGPFWKTAEQTDPAAPIYHLVNGTVFLPILFLVALSAGVLDFCLFLWDQSHEKKMSKQTMARLQTAELAAAEPELSPQPRLPRLTSVDSGELKIDSESQSPF